MDWFWNLFKKNSKRTIKNFSSLIQYQPNDPLTPKLSFSMNLPELPNPCPPFKVEGFTGNDGLEGTLEKQSCGVWTTVALSLANCQNILEKPIKEWPSFTELIINPRAGKMFNAYYDRQNINLFYDNDKLTGSTIYFCESPDVVAHELGHAILDSIRPDLWSIQCVEIQAFHESFGDINTMLTNFTINNMVEEMLLETNGDLLKTNVIARIGEQVGRAIFRAKGLENMPENFALRTAINSYQYEEPEKLPTKAPENQIAGEPHSFSRIFTGAWYKTFVYIFEEYKNRGNTVLDSIKLAKNSLALITYNSIRMVPITAKFYSAVLRAMLIYDEKNNLGFGELIKKAFAEHNISPREGDAVKYKFVDTDKETYNTFSHIPLAIETVKVSDFYSGLDDPIYNSIVQIPNDHPLKLFIDENIKDLQMAISAAKHSLEVIKTNNKIGYGPTAGDIHKSEFSIVEGKLVRNYFSCWHCKNRH